MKSYILLLILLLSTNVLAEIISFEQIVDEAIDYSMELKIIKIDKEIAEAKIQEIHSLYYPNISLGLNAQYTKDLDPEQSGVSTIGDTILSDGTTYESSATLRVDYDVYDFGVKSRKSKIVEIDKKLVDYSINETTQELKLKLLNTYVKLLKNKQELFYSEKIKTLQSEIYSQNKRLYISGQLDRLSVANQAIRVVELDTKIEQIKSSIKELLKQLTFYTNNIYTIDSEFIPLSHQISEELHFYDSFAHKQLEAKIEQKMTEIEQFEREQYPSIKLFAKYNVYGAKECSLWCAMDDMKERNYIIGAGVNISIFSGFSSSATKTRLNAELLKLRLQNTQKEQVFNQQHLEIKKSLEHIETNIKHLEDSLNEHQNKTKMMDRLLKNKEIDSISTLEDQISSIQKQQELNSSLIEQSGKLKEMEIIDEK